MGRKPFFLLSNDDGVHAPGIRALAEAVDRLGDWVIVAPHVEKSGSGRALSLTQPLRCEKLASNIFAVEGTPSDCVIFALNHLLDRKPDWVLSGINRGSNIGQDVHYSGTVAAAMEGCLAGIQSAAFSLRGRRSFESKDYAEAQKVVRLLLGEDGFAAAARGKVVNVNIPDVATSAMKGVRVTPLGRRIYDSQIHDAVDPRGRSYYWIGGGGEAIEPIPGSDCKLLFDGYVTLTVLSPDMTDHAGNKNLASGLDTSLEKRLGDTH